MNASNYIGCLLLFMSLSFTQINAQPKTLRTNGNNSPAIATQKSAKVSYGFGEVAVDALLKIYETEGLSKRERETRVAQLVKSFASLPKNERSNYNLPDSSKRKLGPHSAEIFNYLEWYIYTSGNNSPAIFASGDVEVWYGLPKKVFLRFADHLEKSSLKRDEFETQLLHYKKLYTDLLAHLRVDSTSSIASTAKKLLQEGDIVSATKLFKQDYIESTLKSTTAAYNYGYSLILQQQFEEAKAPLAEAASHGKDSFQFNIVFAFCLQELNEFEDSERFYKLAITIAERSQSSTQLLYAVQELAKFYVTTNQFRLARFEFDRAINLFYSTANSIIPPNDLLMRLAQVYSFLGHPDSALLTLDQIGFMVQRDSATHTIVHTTHEFKLRVEVLFRYGETFTDLGLSEKAERSYTSALTFIHEKLESSLYLQAECFAGLARLNHAIENSIKSTQYALSAYKIDSAQYGAESAEVANDLHLLCQNLANLGKIDSAQLLITRAIKINQRLKRAEGPENAANLQVLADCLAARGKIDSAISLFHMSIQLTEKVYGPNHKDLIVSYLRLGELYHKKNPSNFLLPLRYLDTAGSLLTGTKNPRISMYFHVYEKKANIFRDNNIYDSALYCYELALEYADKNIKTFAITRVQSSLSMTMLKKAAIYRESTPSPQIEALYTKSLHLAKLAGHTMLYVDNLTRFSTYCIVVGEFAQANELCDSALAVLKDRRNSKLFKAWDLETHYFYLKKAMSLNVLGHVKESIRYFEVVKAFALRTKNQLLLERVNKYYLIH